MHRGDLLEGGEGDDVLLGGAGSNMLVGGAGADRLEGGDLGQANYQGSALAVQVNPSTGLGTGGDAEGDTLSGIRFVEGSEQGDVLTADDSGVDVAGREASATAGSAAGLA